MATYAHITADRRSLEDTPALTGRRRFGAGLFAVVVGTGVTAGAAASIADLVPVHPDAEVLRLCGELDALSRALLASDFTALPDTSEADLAEAEQERISAAKGDILDLLCGQPVQTLEGAIALARTMALADEQLFVNGCPSGYHNHRLVAALVGGLTGWPDHGA